METITEFAKANPWPVVVIIGVLALMVCFCVNRFFRTFSLWKNGYPPQHCDADGNLPDKDED